MKTGRVKHHIRRCEKTKHNPIIPRIRIAKLEIVRTRNRDVQDWMMIEPYLLQHAFRETKMREMRADIHCVGRYRRKDGGFPAHNEVQNGAQRAAEIVSDLWNRQSSNLSLRNGSPLFSPKTP